MSPPAAPADAFAPRMAAAIELALRGRGAVEPNPRVGALALRGDEVVGEGWHRGWGQPHAEVEALRAAQARGARCDTVVVTLEPCSTERGLAGKKTPPCVRALLDHGVTRVVVGSADPDPRHRGAGIDALRQHGVDVVQGVLEGECAAINRPFARWLTLERPWTIAKWAMSLDGRIATAAGESRWISGEQARREVHALRAAVDAVVVGLRTARLDDPELTVREVPGSDPLRVVVDPEAALPVHGKLARTARQTPVLALVAEDAPAARVAALAELGVELRRCARAGPRRIDVAAAWRELRARGLRRVLVEGGGGLLGQLFDAGCVDQVVAFVAPRVLGGATAPAPVAGSGAAALAQAHAFAEVLWRPCGDDLMVTAIRG